VVSLPWLDPLGMSSSPIAFYPQRRKARIEFSRCHAPWTERAVDLGDHGSRNSTGGIQVRNMKMPRAHGTIRGHLRGTRSARSVHPGTRCSAYPRHVFHHQPLARGDRVEIKETRSLVARLDTLLFIEPDWNQCLGDADDACHRHGIRRPVDDRDRG
jgi:hypothetical protein